MLFILNNFKYITNSFLSSTSMKLKKKGVRKSQEELSERRRGYSNMGAERLDEEVSFYLDL